MKKRSWRGKSSPFFKEDGVQNTGEGGFNFTAKSQTLILRILLPGSIFAVLAKTSEISANGQIIEPDTNQLILVI